MMGPRFFIKNDGGFQEVPLEATRRLNEDRFDIYWVFNEFKPGERRLKENLTHIKSFFVDTDSISKSLVSKICSKHLMPSSVIESGRGFHLYWHLETPIDATSDPIYWGDWFREFVKTRLVPVFKADPNACDVLRLLRAPMFSYWKDGSGREVKLIYGDENWYTLKQIEDAFPVVMPPKPTYVPPTRAIPRESVPHGTSNNIEDKLPADDWLKMLSGHTAVRSERFTLQARGMVDQIFANGKETPCWVDMNGRIGSNSGGGPTILQWLMWYGVSQEDARSLLNALYGLR